MPRKKQNLNVPFQPVSGASQLTGLSMGSIRQGCKDGTIPHLKVGKDYRINMPLWMEQLEEQCKGGIN